MLARAKSNGFVKLEHDFIRSAVFATLSSHGTRLLLGMADRYNGRNNGSIPYSLKEALAWLHSSKSTAKRTLAELKAAGLIEVVKLGSFSIKAGERKGAATEWRLTFLP